MKDLLVVTLGPVQDFIAAARRTRDLWFGSHLLSEMSRAAARALVDIGGQLVFPALNVGHPELEFCPGPLREHSGQPPLSIANKIVALVADGETAARTARHGALDAWRNFAKSVRERCRGLLAKNVDAVWDEQIATFLEFQAAWLPLADEKDYDDTRRKLEAAIGARKRLRDFPAWLHQRGKLPKSSLDGARETVLAEPRSRAEYLVRRYRISDGEQLDAVGLVKRAGGEPEQFVPIANVALAGWIERLKANAPEDLADIGAACTNAGLGVVDRPDLRWTKAFPHDAMVFFPNRWKPILEEAGFDGDHRAAQAWGEEHVTKRIFKKSPKVVAPSPYVACLVADGDRIGDTLRLLTTIDEQRGFARGLSEFAEAARNIVEQEHRGVLVYGGGDDVLAFVCLDDALACANALRIAFARTARQALSMVGKTDAPRPTLSVGLGIGHVMESMGHLLDLGRNAEKRAKKAALGEGADRNALAIWIDKRSGGEVVWRGTWDQNPYERLEYDRRLLGQRLSMKKVYQVSEDLHRWPEPHILIASEHRDYAQAIVDDVTRTLARTNDVEGLAPIDAGLLLDARASYVVLRQRIQKWVNRMLCARLFNEATGRSTAHD